MAEIRQLECFVAVAECAHFGRAAEALCMSTSAVSKSIRLLERQLGVPLLERDSRHVRLTAAGDRLVERARRILADVAGLAAVVSGEGSSPTTLTLAYRGTARQLMRTLVARFGALHPGVEIVPVCQTVADIHASVLRGVADVGISSSGRVKGFGLPAGLRAATLRSEPFSGLLVPIGHRLSQRPDPPILHDLDGELVVMAARDTHPELLDGIRDFFAVNHVHPLVKEYPAASPQELADLVAVGRGVALVTVSAFREIAPDSAVELLTLRGPSPRYVEVLVWRVEDRRDVVERFVEVALATVGSSRAERREATRRCDRGATEAPALVG